MTEFLSDWLWVVPVSFGSAALFFSYKATQNFREMRRLRDERKWTMVAYDDKTYKPNPEKHGRNSEIVLFFEMHRENDKRRFLAKLIATTGVKEIDVGKTPEFTVVRRMWEEAGITTEKARFIRDEQKDRLVKHLADMVDAGE